MKIFVHSIVATFAVLLLICFGLLYQYRERKCKVRIEGKTVEVLVSEPLTPGDTIPVVYDKSTQEYYMPNGFLDPEFEYPENTEVGIVIH